VIPFFGKKKSEPAADAASGDAAFVAKGAEGAFVPQPEKARKFFDHARAIGATGNNAYAMTLFANGLKLDPANMTAHQEFYEAAIKYYQSGGKPASRSDVRSVDGPGPVDKFVAAEFAWMHDLNNLALALEVAEATVKATQLEFAQWFAPRLLNMLRKQSKKKSYWVQAMNLFRSMQCWNQAFEAGEMALQLDPTDGALQAEIRQLAAQRAISTGGYDRVESAQEGGFRQFIKDADRQKALEEQESLSGGADVEERNLERARRDFEENPMSPEAIGKYAQLLKRRPDMEEKAHEVYMTGYERLGEYRFRMAAGDIRIAQLRRRVEAAKERFEAQPQDLVLKTELADLERQYLELRGAEFRERMAKYPTDRGIKMELGRLEYELGNYEDAMGCFQASKEEAKYRVPAAHLLGKSFAAMGWHTEAIAEFREALDAVDATQKELELPIRYDLMVSLMEQARAERSPAAAKEAFEICSAILRRDIGYRDIREKRKVIDALLKELGG
jgi:tetratricopeptide (TPR) repeat protein